MNDDRTTGLTLPRTALFVLILVLVFASASGCVSDPLSPSEVTRLRILGLEPSPPQPSPGDRLTLELLWTDVTPSCDVDTPCPVGQSCESGQCVRDDDSVEMIWLVIPISAWQSSETGLTELFGTAPGNEVGPDDTQCRDARTLLETCLALNGCFPIPDSPISICCGDESASRIDLQVPADIPTPEPDCNPDSSIDVSATLQITVQVCVGGQLDLCTADFGALSFGCTGEGAETVTAVSRVGVVADQATANTAPVLIDPLWGRIPDPADEEDTFEPAPWSDVMVVQGCQGSGCASRDCRDAGDCDEGQVCEDGSCREVLSVALGGGAQERFLPDCEPIVECEDTSACDTGSICEDGQCRELENPVTAFYGTAGAFRPGRAVLDTTGDGRPNDTRFVTHWLPPTLDPCENAGDPCAFGTCDPVYRLCTGEVSMWVVARDGRGGQDWIERTVRVVP